MTTKSLEYFLVVVKHLNISKAAKELFISQPALSKQISQLEAELGVSLFDRTKHSLKLTHAGEVLLSETNELFKSRMSCGSGCGQQVTYRKMRCACVICRER